MSANAGPDMNVTDTLSPEQAVNSLPSSMVCAQSTEELQALMQNFG